MRYLILLIFVYFYYSYPQTNESYKNYKAQFIKYENVRLISDKNINDLIEYLKPLEDRSFILSKKITGIVSYRLIVDEKGNLKDALLLNNSLKNNRFSFLIDSIICKSLKQSKFKIIGKNNSKYSFLIFYRFKKGKIFPPIINGITYGAKKIKEEDKYFDKPPYLIYKAKLIIPDKIKRKYLNKVVVVTATIGRDGFVEYAKISKSVNSIIDIAAVDATMKCRFRPAYRNHKPIKIRMNIPYRIK